MVPASAPPPLPAFNHFGISVCDLDRSLDFYCDVLGAVIAVSPHDAAESFDGRRAVVLLAGPTAFDINEFATNSGETFDPSHTGLDHLAFGVDSYEALVAWAARLDAKGVTRSPIRELEGVGEIFDFRDPDGIQLEFMHDDLSGWWRKRCEQKPAQARSFNAESAPRKGG